MELSILFSITILIALFITGIITLTAVVIAQVRKQASFFVSEASSLQWTAQAHIQLMRPR